jgi:hypothetical protein
MVIYIKSGVFMAVRKECAAMYTFTDLPNPVPSRREDRRFLWNVCKFLSDQRYLNPQDIHAYPFGAGVIFLILAHPVYKM